MNPPKRRRTEVKPNVLIRDGLRFIAPYKYTFSTGTKKRWYGRTLLDAFSKEFRLFSREYYENAIIKGLLTVNGKKERPDFILRHGNWTEHTTHFHELCVSAETISIIGETDILLAVNKPSGIVVHPCGGYHHNAMTSILENEMGFHDLCCVHRLDYGTSGCLLFAKSVDSASKITQLFQGGKIFKIYIAQVQGMLKNPVVVDQPLTVVDKGTGRSIVDAGGRSCATVLMPIDDSLIMCAPISGRQHQIRVHLAHLGYPIVGDPMYSMPESNGIGRSVNCDEEEGRLALMEEILSESKIKGCEMEIPKISGVFGVPDDWQLEDWCMECEKLKETGQLASHDQASKALKTMRLHAHHYRGPDFKFTAKLPGWIQNE